MKEINSAWSKCPYNENKGTELSSSTFHKYCAEIEEWFDIPVVCVKRGKSAYYYRLGDTSDLMKDNVRDALLNGFLIHSRLSGGSALSDSVGAGPQTAGSNVEMILDAMEKNQAIRIVRRKPKLKPGLMPLLEPLEERQPGIIERTFSTSGRESSVTLEVEPLFIDLTGRGYLISKVKGMRKACIVALSNIVSVEMLDQWFLPPQNVDYRRFGQSPYYAIMNKTPDDRLLYRLDKSLE